MKWLCVCEIDALTDRTSDASQHYRCTSKELLNNWSIHKIIINVIGNISFSQWRAATRNGFFPRCVSIRWKIESIKHSTNSAEFQPQNESGKLWLPNKLIRKCMIGPFLFGRCVCVCVWFMWNCSWSGLKSIAHIPIAFKHGQPNYFDGINISDTLIHYQNKHIITFHLNMWNEP